MSRGWRRCSGTEVERDQNRQTENRQTEAEVGRPQVQINGPELKSPRSVRNSMSRDWNRQSETKTGGAPRPKSAHSDRNRRTATEIGVRRPKSADRNGNRRTATMALSALRLRRNMIFKMVVGIPVVWFSVIGFMVVISSGGVYLPQDTVANPRFVSHESADRAAAIAAAAVAAAAPPVFEPPNVDRLRLEEVCKRKAPPPSEEIIFAQKNNFFTKKTIFAQKNNFCTKK